MSLGSVGLIGLSESNPCRFVGLRARECKELSGGEIRGGVLCLGFQANINPAWLGCGTLYRYKSLLFPDDILTFCDPARASNSNMHIGLVWRTPSVREPTLPARLKQQDCENDPPLREGMVRQLTGQGWVQVGERFLNGTHPVRLRRPPLRWGGFSREERDDGY
jgi:hypothetical protein